MTTALPDFNNLDIANISTQLDKMLAHHQQVIDKLLAQTKFCWENLVYPLAQLDNELTQFWSPVAHLHAVVNSPELRTCYEACLPKISAYYTALGQNEALFNAITALDDTKLDDVQIKIKHDMMQDFKLSGVALSSTKKVRFEALETRLAELANRFDTHVLDATQAFSMHITEEEQLNGLPQHALSAAKERAEQKDLPGWLLTLDFPCYLAVMTYANDAALREQFYYAYVTRASDEGPFANQFDNTKVIEETLALRHEKAGLLGFEHYADLSLATKMASSAHEVTNFLEDLAKRAYPQAQAEIKDLQQYAHTKGLGVLNPWDVTYVSERFRIEHYQLSQEALRPYFPQHVVLQGMFEIIKRLYGMTARQITTSVWHQDVVCYELSDEDNQIRGYIYLDLFARAHKRGGAWMDVLQSRQRLATGEIQLPIATLTCNFAKPAAGHTAAFSHDEVTTLFHEMGHCLHHVLSTVNELAASGVNGVEWDAVELPSQFFENWCWEKEALALLSKHIDPHEPLPEDLFNKLTRARQFQAAMMMMRQVEFSLFDFNLHLNCHITDITAVNHLLQTIREKTALMPTTIYNRFAHSFSHIFAGGYAAGYYSYKWAEVLSSDAYARFEQEGIFSQDTGRAFLHHILEVGSSVPAIEAFVQFRQRSPEISALLRHNGIKA